ncbi:MAG: two component transcriptional regulator, LytTR family [Flavipsychrobacter sp.]|jgi:DNA-binding LytR/AlgR family response regulator|nr:two component transcriptional regulator, LytTR family [Flavipsychrobacter sp.]
MKILILEDEHLVAESLMKLVRQLEPDAVIEGPVDNVIEAKEILSNSRPDLVISDIQLSDGISLDVFTEAKINCPVIFTTAYNEYAVRAFKVNSIDYLLKPIDKKELKAALDKFHLLQSKFSNEQYVQQLSELFSDFRSGKKYKERFTAHHGRNIVLVHSKDVAGFAKEEVIYLVHSDGKKYITDYRSLDEIEELLDPREFYRANRQYIISLSHVDTMRSDETGKVIVRLKPQSFPEIIVSKEKAAAFRKWVEG